MIKKQIDKRGTPTIILYMYIVLFCMYEVYDELRVLPVQSPLISSIITCSFIS